METSASTITSMKAGLYVGLLCPILFFLGWGLIAGYQLWYLYATD